MSLPPATKDISAHPGASSVVDPVNKTVKNADVDRKLRLYGVIEAFRKGKLPSNAQIDETLRYVVDHSPVDLKDLSPEGRKLIQDTREIITTAGLLVQEKNADELFQQFVWHTRNLNTDPLKSGDLTEAIPVEAGKAKADSDNAVKHLRTLLNLVLTNSEVRKLLSDFSVIGREVLSKGASKVASTIGPSEEELRNIDQSAPNDQFITKVGRVAGPNETPVLEARLPGTQRTLEMHPREDQARMVNPDGTQRPIGEIRDQALGQYEQTKDQAAPLANQATNRAASQAQEVADADDDKKRGMMGKMRQIRDNVRDNLNDRIPQDKKDSAKDNYERGKQFLTDDLFPEERRDQFIFRGKKVILECQRHDDYQESIRWLLSYIEEYARHGRTTAEAGVGQGSSISKDPDFNLAVTELRTLLERFANNISMDIIFDAANVLIDDSRRDPDLREWFKAVDHYIRKVLLEPGYILEPDCNTQANQLRERGRGFYDEKYKSHFDNLFNSVGDWFKAMGQDPTNKRFGEDWARLTKDLLFDSEGSLTFKPALWNDIRKVILPKLIDEVGYIPIPRVEYSDDSLDLVVENLTLQGRNLFPNIVALEANNFVKFSPYSTIQDQQYHRIKLTLEQMQADMRDVAFYYRKKTGIAKLKDSGIADVLLGGEGLNVIIELHSPTRDRSSVFKVHNIHVKVSNLKFAIRDSNHDFLYKTLRPLATGLIKKQIEKAIKDALTTGLEYIDGQLVAVRDRMEMAKATDGQSRTDVLKDLFKSNKDEGSVKAADSKSHLRAGSQFKVVSDKRHSILANKGNPAGWVNRAAEKQELASSGKEWRSDAFSIIPGSGVGDAEKRTSAPAGSGHGTSHGGLQPVPRV
ncbi:hypothetical protein M413DRAFT_447366 [Hebeloma cylindrosporum]|uniref:Uncharacterized protein n=1 Tax=Hebeloma cylindrosporum TaxID=76867 RepID=A0A0C2XMT8_HEBCY|nr:hypothetical protein M413DRAFT_447366 [Hebeloma cylindrosporum h7]